MIFPRKEIVFLVKLEIRLNYSNFLRLLMMITVSLCSSPNEIFLPIFPSSSKKGKFREWENMFRLIYDNQIRFKFSFEYLLIYKKHAKNRNVH